MVSCPHPSVNPRNTGGEGQGLLRRGHREGLGLTRLSSSGSEENSGLSERIWEGEERPGKESRLLPTLPAASLVLALGLPTCLAKAAMSSLKESEEQTSPPGGAPSPAEAPSRGEHVASSHFSKTRAKSGKRGCLVGQEVGIHGGSVVCSETDTGEKLTPGDTGHPGHPALSTHP